MFPQGYGCGAMPKVLGRFGGDWRDPAPNRFELTQLSLTEGE
jgi:hypothetical protein